MPWRWSSGFTNVAGETLPYGWVWRDYRIRQRYQTRVYAGTQVATARTTVPSSVGCDRQFHDLAERGVVAELDLGSDGQLFKAQAFLA